MTKQQTIYIKRMYDEGWELTDFNGKVIPLDKVLELDFNVMDANNLPENVQWVKNWNKILFKESV